MIIDLEPADRVLLARCIRLGDRQARAGGRRLPQRLLDLAAALERPGAAMSGHERPNVDGLLAGADGAPVASELLTFDEAAGRLRVSARTVRRMTDDGRLAVVSVGGRLRRVPAAAIEAYERKAM